MLAGLAVPLPDEPSYLTLALFSEAGSLNEPGAHQFDQTSWSVEFQGPTSLGLSSAGHGF